MNELLHTAFEYRTAFAHFSHTVGSFQSGQKKPGYGVAIEREFQGAGCLSAAERFRE